MKAVLFALLVFTGNIFATTTHDVCQRSEAIRAYLEMELRKPCFAMTDADLQNINSINLTSEFSTFKANDFQGLTVLGHLRIEVRNRGHFPTNTFNGYRAYSVTFLIASGADFETGALNGLTADNVTFAGGLSQPFVFAPGALNGLTTPIIFIDFWDTNKQARFNELVAEYPNLYFSKQN